MKVTIERELEIVVGDSSSQKVTLEEASLFVTDILKRNINMVSELTEKAIEKYGIAKIAKFYNDKQYADLAFIEIDIDKLTNDFVELDKILCVDETYFFKSLGNNIFGFNAISIPHTRSKETERRLRFTADNSSHYMHSLPTSLVNLTKNLIAARLERGGL